MPTTDIPATASREAVQAELHTVRTLWSLPGASVVTGASDDGPYGIATIVVMGVAAASMALTFLLG